MSPETSGLEVSGTEEAPSSSPLGFSAEPNVSPPQDFQALNPLLFLGWKERWRRGARRPRIQRVRPEQLSSETGDPGMRVKRKKN